MIVTSGAQRRIMNWKFHETIYTTYATWHIYTYSSHIHTIKSEFSNTLMTRGSQKSDDTYFLEFILMVPKL